MIYPIRLGILIFADPLDKIADRILADAMVHGIVSYGDPPGRPIDGHNEWKRVMFGNGASFTFVSKSWMNPDRFARRGTFHLPDGFTYEYSARRPRSKTMWLFKQQIRAFKQQLVDTYLHQALPADTSDYV